MFSTFRTDIAAGSNQCWNMVRNIAGGGNMEIGRLFHVANNSFQIQVVQPNGALWLRNSANGAFRLNPDGNASVNGFTINAVGFGSLGSQNPGINTFNPWARFSLMHQNIGTAPQITAIQTCFRPWFGNAVLGMGNADLFYFGHKYQLLNGTGAEQNDNSDVVAAWGEPSLPAGMAHRFDNFQFRFIGATDATTGAGTIDGLELMRLRPFRLNATDAVQGFVGVGDWSNSGGLMPEERLDVMDRTMRLRGLPTATYQVTTPGDWDRVMIVQADGTVKWRNASTIGGGGGGVGCDWTVTPPAQKQLLAAYVTPSGASCPEEDWRVSIGTVLGITTKLKVYGRKSVGDHGGAIQAEFQTTGTGVGGSGVSASLTHETAGTPITGDAIGVLTSVTDAGYRGWALKGDITVAGSGAETMYGLSGRLTLNSGSNTSVAAYGTASNVIAQQSSTANSVYGMYTTVTGSGSMNSVSGVSSLVNLTGGTTGSSYGADAISQWTSATLTNSTGILAKSTNLTSTFVQKSIGADVSAAGGSTQTLGVQSSGYGEEVEGVPTTETKGVKSLAHGPVLLATGVYGKGANYGFAFHRRVGVHGATFVSSGDVLSEHISILGEGAGNGAQQWAGLFEDKVQIQGNLVLGGTLIFSDAGLKTEVQELGDLAGGLMSLMPRRYQYTEEAKARLNLPEGEQLGFVAQELEEHYPNLVMSTIAMAKRDSVGNVIASSLEIKAVNYIGLIPVLTAGHQQQENRLAAVEAQLAQALEQLANCCVANDGTRAPTGGANSSIASENDLRIVPNPVADRTELRYTLANEGGVRLEITDATGRTMLVQDEGNRPAGSYAYEWNTTLLAPGTYHCALYVNDEFLMEKAVKLNSR